MAADGSIVRACSHWRRQLFRVALNPEEPGTLTDLTRVLSQATRSQGAVLWEARGGQDGAPPASVLSRWFDDRVSPEIRGTATPDPVTLRALRARSLALPADLPGASQSLFGLPVAASMPVEYADGSVGALTLLGENQLSDAAFDVAVTLVEATPELLTILRERRTLALAQACDAVLHNADVESPEQPLPRDRLGEHLTQVCRLVERTLECAEVAIYLQETHAGDDRYPLFASSGPSGQIDTFDGPSGSLTAAPPRDQVDDLLLQLPLRSGDQVWGVLRCSRGQQSLPHFTRSDLPLLQPVATQLAQYWLSWLHRQTISAENDSWRRLAAGISGLNRLIAQELRGNAAWDLRRDKRISAAALRIVQDVVPELTQGVVSSAEPAGESQFRLVPVSSIGAPRQDTSIGSGSSLAEHAFRNRCQSWTTDPEELAREAVGPDAGWLLCTPVGVGDQAYGVLHATGPAGELPDNSAQLCEIVADQLGLYRHVQEARQVLQASVRSQAEAMEDLKHQLASPLRIATDRATFVLDSRRFDSRAEAQLKAVRGLCRKASRVAISAGVFAALSRGEYPDPKAELLGVDELLRLVIGAADDAQVLSNPKLGITFDVDRDAVRQLGRRLVDVDVSFLHQCIGNVLDNAGKYSYSNTSVRIGATVTASQLVLEVTSVGIPLAPADTSLCLQRNWRGELARNTTGEGSGVGLWVVDHLMRAMKGMVRLRPEGDTTTVQLLLPLA